MGDAAKAAARPLLSYFNKRFEDVFQHITNEVREAKLFLQADVRSALDEQQGTSKAAVDGLRSGITALAEGSVLLQQAAARFERTLLDVSAPAEAEAVVARLEDQPALAQRFVALVASRPLSELPDWLAGLGNWLASHRSPLAERGLWLNHPVSVALFRGNAVVGGVNERIVEVPFVFEVAATAGDGPVLDIGSAESTLALSLASAGRKTYAVDPRGYPFSHPQLTVVASPLEAWEGPAQPLALAISLSTIEHFGVGHYDLEEGDLNRGDRDALDRIRSWMAPGGTLALTAPYGRESIDDVQRVYSASSLRRLLDGWAVRELRYARRLDAVTWVPCEADDLVDADEAGVVLVHATAG